MAESRATDVIALQQAGTLYGLFLERLQRSPDNTAYQYFDADSQQWQSMTWQNAGREVSRWQQALKAENCRSGDRVALNLRNGPDWIFFDQAAQSLGLVVVPLYPDDRPDNVAYILRDAAVKLLLVQSEKQWRHIKAALGETFQLKRIIIQQNHHNTPVSENVSLLTQWLNAPSELLPVTGENNQLASIIYTSGTTGRPKGVMLSHSNMLAVAHGALQHFTVYSDDLFLSFLPLSHTLERTAGYYLPIMAGGAVAFSRGISQLADDIQTVGPTILIAVPRIFERIASRIDNGLNQRSAFIRLLFKLTVKVGWHRFLYQQRRKRFSPLLWLWPHLDKLLARKIREKLGPNLRLTVTGGAAMPQSVAQLFLGLGVNLLQGYGLTETAPIVSVNQPEDNDPDSVGPPIDGVNVDIGENQELLVKGPGNMLGYWNNHAATATTIDSDGWLHTGDQAKIGDNGHIYITGRIKDILVLNNGEKVPPGDIESAILTDSLFEQVLVTGEGQAYLGALVVLNSDQWFSLAKTLHLDPMQPESLRSKALQKHVVHRIRQQMHDFPSYAKIRRVVCLLESWTLEAGLLTPTLKIKRQQVLDKYQREVADLFD